MQGKRKVIFYIGNHISIFYITTKLNMDRKEIPWDVISDNET